MNLLPEEEKKLREEVRKELEEKERRALLERERMEDEEFRKSLEREKKRIAMEEERRFYEERGLQRYVNHYGRVEWLTPEEIEGRKKGRVRKKRRRRSRKKSRYRVVKVAGDAVLFVLVLGALGGILFFPSQFWGLAYKLKGLVSDTQEVCSLEVTSNVKGAAIYLDGEFVGQVTDGVISGLDGGVHSVAVVKPGYSADPPEAKVQVVEGEVSRIEFQLVESTGGSYD